MMAEWARALAMGIGGAADSGAQTMGDQIKNDENVQMQGQLEQQAADTKLDMASRQAAAEVLLKQQAAARFQAAQQGIINDKMNQKYGTSDAAVADADAGNTDAPLTDDQKAAIAQAKQLDTNSLMHNSDIMTQAGLQTGDINPEQAVTNASRSDIAQLKMEGYKDRNDMMLQIGLAKADAQTTAAQIRADAMMARVAAGQGTTKDQANVAQIEYLMKKQNLSKEQALDLVYGNGEAAHKSADDRVSSMTTSLISSGQVRVTKDDPPGTTVASKAMRMARDAIGAGSAAPVPSPSPRPGNMVPNSFAPGQPGSTQPNTKDPLGLFR
jgi:hypothetical protein